ARTAACDPAARTGTGTPGRARVALQYRTIRAVASAVLLAAAIGAGGMGGMTAALAADPGMTTLVGTVTGAGDARLPGVHLTITETSPSDEGLAAVQVVTASDGTFSADLYAWGSSASPASITIVADDQIEVIGASCTETWSVRLDEADEIAWADSAPAPHALV